MNVSFFFKKKKWKYFLNQISFFRSGFDGHGQDFLSKVLPVADILYSYWYKFLEV